MSEHLTLEELVERAGQALAAIDVRAPNGRVTGLPDARMIRWYATIGLVDKPSGMRGRTALYGQRHLLQLVAVKRRQAEGRPLADIQAELAGATDALLTRIAALPATDAVDVMDAMAAADAADAMAAVDAVDAMAAADAVDVMDVMDVMDAGDAVAALPAHGGLGRGRDRFWAGRPGLRHAVTLGGAVLVLPTTVSDADAAAIRAAAQPLIDLLRDRGITEEGAQ